jgi:hypothetical protein
MKLFLHSEHATLPDSCAQPPASSVKRPTAKAKSSVVESLLSIGEDGQGRFEGRWFSENGGPASRYAGACGGTGTGSKLAGRSARRMPEETKGIGGIGYGKSVKNVARLRIYREGASMAGGGSPGAGERGAMVPAEWRERGKEWMSFGMGT